jgi:hypothetical protein
MSADFDKRQQRIMSRLVIMIFSLNISTLH